MLSVLKNYTNSFERFVQLLYGLRRRILDSWYRLFHKLIVRKINKYSGDCIHLQDISDRLQNILSIPDILHAEEAEKIAIVKAAEKTVHGVYSILGLVDAELDPVEWHTDFKSGFRWPPGTFYRKYIQEGIDSDSDVKVPRELSRCHHLIKLGLAYRLTNNPKYAEMCFAQMNNWIDENPLMYSINWGCTMDVAIRAVNWIWTLGLIAGTQISDDERAEKIVSSLYQHGWFIWRNPEKKNYNNGNHYLADLAGQIYLGLLFKDLEEPGKWLEKGKEELFREIRMQILPSGMSYERSTSYNRLVLELVLGPILLLKSNAHEIPADIWYRLEKMFEFIMYSLKPDGTSPVIGDQDNGRLLPFGADEINDFRYLLSLGAVLFKRPDFKYFGDGFNVYCLLLGGRGAFDRWNNITDIKTELDSRSFPDSGIYICRKNDNYLLFNATGKGLYPELNSGTHTHSDLLSFELFTYGKSFLVDPGSYVYTADAEKRMLFRSTRMHNTVTVDGESQNIIRKEVLWNFSRDAIPEVYTWDSNDRLDIVAANHNGYNRLDKPVTHERTVIFDKIKERWSIKDTIYGEGDHACEWFFHFDAGIDFEIAGNSVTSKCEDGNNIMISFSGKDDVLLKKDKSYVSKSYGIKQENKVLTASIKGTVPIILNIEIRKLIKA